MAEEFDGCECVWSHEFAMRRLLTLIRQGQSYCTDTECIDLTQRLENSNHEEPENFTILMLFMMFAAFFLFFRPNSFIRSVNNSNKHGQPPSGGQGPNSDAPPAVN